MILIALIGMFLAGFGVRSLLHAYWTDHKRARLFEAYRSAAVFPVEWNVDWREYRGTTPRGRG